MSSALKKVWHHYWLILGLHLFLFQHDAQMDYYGTRLATCSSDRTVKIFDVRNGGQILVADLRGYDVVCLSYHPSYFVTPSSLFLF